MGKHLLLTGNVRRICLMNKDANSKKEYAIYLLTQNANDSLMNNIRLCNYLDEYGNYVFATDMTIAEPNTAYGSAEGYSNLLKCDINRK